MKSQNNLKINRTDKKGSGYLTDMIKLFSIDEEETKNKNTEYTEDNISNEKTEATLKKSLINKNINISKSM